MNRAEIERRIPKFEGLLFTTASIVLEQRPELDRDDVMQRLRIKVWKGLESYNPARAKQPVEGYVFSCVVNERKDIVKMRRVRDLFIEDAAPVGGRQSDGGVTLRDAFERRYLSIDADQAFASVDEQGLALPASLTPIERQVIGLLYEECTQGEIREALDLSSRKLYALLGTIREKMADWRPAAGECEPGLAPPLSRPLVSQLGSPIASMNSSSLRSIAP